MTLSTTKTTWASIILGIVYISILFAINPIVSIIIDNEVDKDRTKALNSLHEIFSDNDIYIDVEFKYYNNSYKRIPIPQIKKPEFKDVINHIQGPEIFRTDDDILAALTYNQETIEKAEKEIIELRKLDWEKKYANVKEIYDISVSPDDPEKKGWALKVISPTNQINGFIEYYIIPTKLVYKKLGPLAGMAPNINDALSDVFDFLTTDSESPIKEYYNKNCLNHLKSDIFWKVNNKHFHLGQDPFRNVHFQRSSDECDNIYEQFGFVESKKPKRLGTVTNYYWEATYSMTQPKTYSLICVDDEFIESEKFNTTVIAAIIWSILCAAIGYYIFWLNKKHNQNVQSNLSIEETKTSLYSRLKYLCSPNRYMHPYDERRAEIANDLYPILLNIDSSDIKALKSFRKSLADKLDIKIINSEYIDYLKGLCNTYLSNPITSEKGHEAKQIQELLFNHTLTLDDIDDIEYRIESITQSEIDYSKM